MYASEAEQTWKVLAPGLTVVAMANDGSQTVDHVLEDAERLLKTPMVEADCARRGVNTSLALLAIQGLRAYLAGDRVRSADDLATVAEEIRARHESATARRGESS